MCKFTVNYQVRFKMVCWVVQSRLGDLMMSEQPFFIKDAIGPKETAVCP